MAASRRDELSADELNLRGDQFLHEFLTTGNFEHVRQAIAEYEKAAACLSADDPRLAVFLINIAVAHEARYHRLGWLDDLEKAIIKKEEAVAVTAEEDTNLPRRLNSLGASLTLRFEDTGRLNDISKAIINQQRSVQLTQDGDLDLPDRLSDLGNSFFFRFEHNGDLEDISEAIRNQQRAIQLTKDGDADLPGRLSNLGNSFSSRFDHTGNLEDISEAIQSQKRAVQLTPDGDPNLPGQLNNLGTSFSSRFDRTGDLKDLSEAIRNQQLAVRLTPEGHPNLQGRLNNLGKSLSSRFKHTRNLDDISDAIRHQQIAVQLTQDGHPNLPTWLNNLGSSFSSRFDYTGDLEDVSRAIRNQQLAIQLTPDGHHNLPTWLDGLGASFISRFEHTGKLEDISEAIRNQQLAVQLTPDGHASLPDRLSNLGNSLLFRFRTTGDMEDAADAIRHQQRAVQLTPNKFADLPARFNNLGIAFFSRFEHTRDLEDISEAIQSQRRAVQLTPNGHSDLPSRLSNLGNSLLCRFELDTRDLEDISEAIRNQQRAVELTSDSDSSLPGRLNNLGNALSSRFERTGDLDDISEAIRNQQRAVQLTTDGHHDRPVWIDNLGNSYLSRFKHTGNRDDVSQAIQNYQRAVQHTPDGHAVLTGRLSNLGMAFAHHFECTGDDKSLSAAVLNYRLAATSRTGPPYDRLIAAQRWATLSQQSSLSSEQLEAHACSINLLSLISGLGNTVRRRHQTLATFSQLCVAASATALSLGHPDKALEWLVEGRCIVWNQVNQLRTPVDELRSYDPALAERLSVLSRKLENAGLRADSRGGLSMDDKISLEDEARMHVKDAKDWDQLVDTIRIIPQFKDFLRPRKCVDIMSRLPEEGPVVIINMHRDRCDALGLVAGAGKPLHIPLPNFSYKEAERLADGMRRHLLSFGIRSRVGVPLLDNDPPPFDFSAVLGTLWSDLVSPILGALSLVPTSSTKKTRILWCPTGPLTFLPIHAAGLYYEEGDGIPGKFLSEFVVSSYIPTLNLREASKSVKDCHNVPTGMLMISQPNTPGKFTIPFAAVEVEKIEKQLQARDISSCTLADEKATVNRVLESMEKYSCVHLACHASQNEEIPLKSSIHLHDGSLELSEIMKKNLHNSNFAFLSACQTSKSHAKLPEEVVHLASGMLAAGYHNVVGTMWSVIDEPSPDLAEYFYESLLEDSASERPRIDGHQAAWALHNATKRLREKLSGSPYSFLSWVPYVHLVFV